MTTIPFTSTHGRYCEPLHDELLGYQAPKPDEPQQFEPLMYEQQRARRQLPLAKIDPPASTPRRQLPLPPAPKPTRGTDKQFAEPHRQSLRSRPWKRYMLDASLALLLLCACIVGLGLYFTTRFAVMSGSMEPTLPVGETVWAVRTMEAPARGDIVSFPNPANERETLIKRVVGLPGERIEAFDGVVHVNFGELDESVWTGISPVTADFEPVTLGEGEYFMLGDNRDHSLDSRQFGPIDEGLIDYKIRLDIEFLN